MAFLLPTFQKLEGPGGLYLGFAGIAALAWAVIYFIVIETKMKTLEEIEAIMIGSKRKRGMSSMESSGMADEHNINAKQGLANL